MRTLGVVVTLLLVAALGVSYYITGTGLRWQEAYSAMGVVDGGPSALAQARADDEAPEGLPLERRLRAPGSLVRLRYEQLDQSGVPVARYEVRALVPPLPTFDSGTRGRGVPRTGCPPPCRAQLERAGATLIEGSGAAGLADEWLLRMPVGKTFSLGLRSLRIQDIGQKQARTLPQAQMQVTLLDACEARVRIGSSTRLHLTDTVLPLPTGFVTNRWVQIEGCQALMVAAPPKELLGPSQELAKPAPRFRSSWAYSRPEYEAIKPEFVSNIDELTLNVNEIWLAGHGHPLLFHLRRACRFDRATAQWQELPAAEGDSEIPLQAAPATMVRPAYHFPRQSALYFAEWAERWHDGSEHVHRALVPSGSTVCLDNDLPPPAPGQVLACVPQGSSSETMLVPAPEPACRAAAAIANAAPATRE